MPGSTGVPASRPISCFSKLQPKPRHAPPAGNATEGTSILDWLANRDDMHILFQAVLSAGFADMFNGGWVGACVAVVPRG